MRRRTIGIAAGVALLLVLGAFGVMQALGHQGAGNAALVAAKPSTCDDAFRVLKLVPSAVAAARPVCLVQSIQLSGELKGSVGQAYVSGTTGVAASEMCTVPKRWENFPPARLMLAIGGKAYRLTISATGSSEHEPVTFNQVNGHVDLASVADPNADWNQASGSFALNANGVSGTLAVDLLRDIAGAQPVHISGQWTCGAPLAANADAAVPCALFYALNQLPEADVARMKAKGCLAEDLTFSGAIAGRLDHAINDATYAREPGIDGDNNCLAVGDQYDASLKFSIGDESFLLNLNPRAYPGVGPGTYAAGSGAFSANAFLWLGTADATHNGLFVTDQHVYWYGSSGSFTIARDMRSGTVDETFTGMFDHAGSTVHIAGSWRCA